MLGITVTNMNGKGEPYFAVCLNCEWFNPCPNKESAETQAETHNLKYHYEHFHWETFSFREFGFEPDYYEELMQLLKAMTRHQRHEWFVKRKSQVYLIVGATV